MNGRPFCSLTLHTLTESCGRATSRGRGVTEYKTSAAPTNFDANSCFAFPYQYKVSNAEIDTGATILGRSQDAQPIVDSIPNQIANVDN